MTQMHRQSKSFELLILYKNLWYNSFFYQVKPKYVSRPLLLTTFRLNDNQVGPTG